MLKKIKQFIKNQFERQTEYLAEYLSEQSVLNTDRTITAIKTLSNDIVSAVNSKSNTGVETRLEAITGVLQGVTKEISVLGENIREKELEMKIPKNWNGSPWSQLEGVDITLKECKRLLTIISSSY